MFGARRSPNPAGRPFCTSGTAAKWDRRYRALRRRICSTARLASHSGDRVQWDSFQYHTLPPLAAAAHVSITGTVKSVPCQATMPMVALRPRFAVDRIAASVEKLPPCPELLELRPLGCA